MTTILFSVARLLLVEVLLLILLMLVLLLILVLAVLAGGAGGGIDITVVLLLGAGCRGAARCILYTFCPTSSRYIKTTRTDYWLQDHTKD